MSSAHRETDDGLAITPDRMSDELAAELVSELDLGDWELTPWQASFIESNLGRRRFSLKQKEVIYSMSRKLRLI